MLIIALAKSASNLSYTGSPRPTGIPWHLNSMIAPKEVPSLRAFVIFTSHSFIIFLSGQKKSFFSIKSLFQLS